MCWFGKKKTTESKFDITLGFMYGEEVTYKEAEGFFVYNGEVFYKVKGGAGKNIKTGKNFSEMVAETVEGEAFTAKSISTTMVKLLKLAE